MPLSGTTTGADILGAVLEFLNKHNFDLSKLVSVTTDGAPAMVGSKKGFVALLEKHLVSNGFQNNIIKLHCVIHQEALCAKSCNIKDIMSTVIKIINFILSRGLNHRLFRQLLQDMDATYTDLVYYCDVRWLSRGKMLLRFFSLRKEIQEFLVLKGQHYPELQDPHWVSNLAFLVDITQYLNKLNLRLQGSNQLVNIMYETIESYAKKN